MAVHETVLRAALDGVADGVAEVQVAADTGVELIVRDIVRFDLHAFGDHVGDVRPDSVRALREDLKEAGALEHSVLDALGTAVMEDDVRQGLEGVDVADDPKGLLERADEVLARGDVHRGLAADGGVHGCQQRGRHLDVVDAPQEGGRREAGQVAGDAAAEGDEQVGAGEALPGAEIQDGAHDVEGLGGLSGGEDELDGLKAFLLEGLPYGLHVQGRHIAVRDDSDFTGLVDFFHQLAGVFHEASPDEDIVVPGGRYVYGLGAHDGSPFLVLFLSSFQWAR